ncbi:hypothetical protein [Streptosporangium oxazolinicum]|uniref:hypothetical protein n=1 Tax=Streptosporangium oxazolinicum TaxID=909287 RepID=UPI0031F0C4A0
MAVHNCTKKNPHNHHSAPFGYLSTQKVLTDIDLVVTEIAARVTAEDLLSSVVNYPPVLRKRVLRHVGLSDMRSISKSAATSLVHALRGNDRKRSASLTHVLSLPFIHGFENHDELTAEACARLLLPSSAAEAMSSASIFVEMLANTRHLTDNLAALVLVHICRYDVPLSPIALALLVPSSERMDLDAAETIRTAWQEFRAPHSELPETPISLSELRDAARQSLPAAALENSDLNGIKELDHYDPEESTLTTEPEEPQKPATDSAHILAEDSVEALREEMSRLRQTLLKAAEAAGNVQRACADARRPLDHDLEVITRSVVGFDGLRDRLASAADSTIADDGTVAALQRTLDHVVAAGSRRRRILALAHLEGPPVLETLLEEVRAAARGESPILETLAELIHLADDADAFLRTSELHDRFRREAPDGWAAVALAAVQGRLTVPEPLDIASSTPADSGFSEGDQPDQDERDGGGTPPTTDEPETPSPTQGAALPPPTEDQDELADLDAFLEEGLRRPAESSVREPSTSEQTPSDEPATAVTDGPASPDFPAGPAAEITPVNEESEEPARPGMTTIDHVSPSPTDHLAGLPPKAAEAEAEAIRAGQLGLAAWLRVAAGRPSAEVNARRCAAMAAEMSEFAGRLSAMFTESVANVTSKALAEDTAGQLLGWAAAIRAGLIHPTPETAPLIEDLSPVVSDFPALTAYGKAFAKVAKDGAYLVPGLSGRLQDASQAENSRKDASLAALRFLEEAPSQTIKFQRATEVWKFLLQENAPLGALLAVAARDDENEMRNARAKLKELRAGHMIDRTIDAAAKERTSNRGSSRIHSSARIKLVEKVNRALDLVATWVTAVHEVEALRTDGFGVPSVVGALNDLRAVVNQNRVRAEEELVRLAESAEPLAAAASAASTLVRDTLRLLDGSPPPESEPSIAHVLNGDLLFSPTIRVDADTLAPYAPPALSELTPLCGGSGRDWRAAFLTRADLGDHEGTQAVIAVLSAQGQALAAELQNHREKLVSAARNERGDRIENVRDQIAEWRRDGVLPEIASTRFSATLQTLAGDERDDFGVIFHALEELKREAEKIRDDRIAVEQERLAALSAENSNVADVQERIKGFIDVGDLTTAHEFIAQAQVGKPLPERSDAVDHLSRFFPHFPRAFEGMSSRSSRRQRPESDDWLQKLKEALKFKNDVTDPELGDVLAQAGLSVSGIPRGRFGVSEYGLRFWQTMSQGPKAAGNLKSAIAAVLQMIGLEADQEAGHNEAQNRTWVALSNVSTIGEALLPAFGSRMSPSGDRLKLLLVWKSPGPQQVVEWLKEQPEDQTVLVFYFGVLTVEQRRQLIAVSRKRPIPVTAVIDDAAVSYLALLPEANWTSTVSLLAPFSSANPYAPTGDVPEEMFYGRSDQLQEVTSRTGSSFVYGGRQLGKSALLRKAERQIRKSDPDRKIIFEIIQDIGRMVPVESLWPMLAGKLAAAEILPQSARTLSDPKEICHGVKEWIEEDPARQLLILLDEADEFLNEDARRAFSNVIALRNLMNETDHRVKVVFAGLHKTARFDSLSNQPLAHLGEHIAIGPLDPQDAFNLLTRPLAALGLRFPATLASRVIAEANNAPALIQLFAESLLTRLRRLPAPQTALPYEITREDVDAVWRDNKLAGGFRHRFELTLNLDKRYKVIAYVVAFHSLDAGADATMTAGELRVACQGWWPQGFKDSSSDGFRGLLEECVNLGVLAADRERYRLRTPHILNLLGGTDEVEAVLEQAESFEQADSFDAQSYRAAYLGHRERSPLTGSQVSWLLRRRNVLHLIAGSKALQLDRVAAALQDEARRHGQAQTWRVGENGLTFDGAIQRASNNSGHNLVIVDLSGLSHIKGTGIMRSASRAVSLSSGGTLAIAVIAPPEHALQWLTVDRGADTAKDEIDDLTSTANLVELQPFNRPGVRQWMYEEGLGFQDETSQGALLRVTGGWPVLISKVIQDLSRPDVDREHALETCRTYLHQRPDDFVKSTGVLSGMALGSAWRELVRLTEIADDSETISDLLALAGAEEEGHPLSESHLREEGYVSTADLVEVLRTLGALVPRTDGKLERESVLMNATRRMERSR